MAIRFFACASAGAPFEFFSPTALSQRIFFCGFMALGSVISLQANNSLYLIVLCAVASTVGFAATSMKVKRYPFVAETIHLIGFVLTISVGHFMIFSLTSQLARQRSAASLLMITKHVPLLFSFRHVPCMLFLVWTLLLDWANGNLMLLYHGDEYTITMALEAFVWTWIYGLFALAQLSRIELLYTVDHDLKAEKTAMECLLSLLCDCQLLIHGDGKTVLRSDLVFDNLTGRAMEATQLVDKSGILAGDSERLRDAFERALDEPVILPISIGGESSDLHAVDLLIVKRSTDRTIARGICKTYHGGRANGSDSNISFLVGVRITGVRIGRGHALGRIAEEESCNINVNNNELGVYTPPGSRETLAPGSRESFARASRESLAHAADMGDDHSERTTATGLVFESLQAALMIDDRDSVTKFFKRITLMARSEKWLVPLTDITLSPGSILGSGGFGIVISAKMFGTCVAMKMVRTHDSDVQKHLPSLLSELRVLRGIHHPNVVQFFGACMDLDNVEIGLVFEKVPGICLHHFVRGSPEMPTDRRVRCDLVCDISGAVRFLHAQKPSIVHSDLKPSNIMVESRGWESTARPTAKLLDFGLARFATRNANPSGGTLHWVAPETIRNSKILLQPSVDVYSFGHLIFFLNTGKSPLEDASREEILYRARLKVQTVNLWPHGVEPFAEDCKDLVARCVSMLPQHRPPMARVHIATLQWGTHQTEEPLFHEEVTWVEGLKIVRAGENLDRRREKSIRL